MSVIEKIVMVSKPKPHIGQTIIVNGAKRFNVIANGRRWGNPIVTGKQIGRAHV